MTSPLLLCPVCPVRVLNVDEGQRCPLCDRLLLTPDQALDVCGDEPPPVDPSSASEAA